MITKIIDFALKQKLAIIVMSVILALWGVISFLNIPIEAFFGLGSPRFNPKNLTHPQLKEWYNITSAQDAVIPWFSSSSEYSEPIQVMFHTGFGHGDYNGKVNSGEMGASAFIIETVLNQLNK